MPVAIASLMQRRRPAIFHARRLISFALTPAHFNASPPFISRHKTTVLYTHMRSVAERSNARRHRLSYHFKMKSELEYRAIGRAERSRAAKAFKIPTISAAP